MEKTAIYIWGCGRNGKAASQYYADNYQILGFIDNEEKTWGSKVAGYFVYSPDQLYIDKEAVIVAVAHGFEEIMVQLTRQYGIEEVIRYTASESRLNGRDYLDARVDYEGKVVVALMGGIGNQMFQYAFGRASAQMGNKVVYDISRLSAGTRTISSLTHIFANCRMEFSAPGSENYYRNKYGRADGGIYRPPFFREREASEIKKIEVEKELLQEPEGYFWGYWQSEKYFSYIKEDIRHAFVFSVIDKSLYQYAKEIRTMNAVSIHIRRGDYLIGNNQEIFGDICTIEYYKAAVSYMEEIVHEPKFYIFSNDMHWVRENIHVPNAKYVEESLFDRYEDWYDMYLMSVCKHNIIANSSFSWWGAWLNVNMKKIVIAPRRWFNGCEAPDICPSEWVRL